MRCAPVLCSRPQLRRQIGTLRFDLDNLVAAKGSGSYEVDQLVKDVRARHCTRARPRPGACAAIRAAICGPAARAP